MEDSSLTDYIDSFTKGAGTILGALKGTPKAVAGTPAARPSTFNWTPWAIGGAGVLALVLILGVMRRK